jgi:endonuclease-3
MDKKALCREIIEKLEQEYPGAGTRLNFTSVFQLVVAVVLSAQSTDDQVNRVTVGLFAKYPTAYHLSEASLEELEQDIRGVGLYHNKAKNIQKLARVLVDQYHGEVPEEFDRLLALPGVGRKSANVILSVGFGQPGLGVDTHVTRVANRLGLVSTTNPTLIERELKSMLPEEKWGIAHHLLIAHGREICRARKPECSICVLNELCPKIID